MTVQILGLFRPGGGPFARFGEILGFIRKLDDILDGIDFANIGANFAKIIENVGPLIGLVRELFGSGDEGAVATFDVVSDDDVAQALNSLLGEPDGAVTLALPAGAWRIAMMILDLVAEYLRRR